MACCFFAAISGSGPACVAAIGAILIPAMKRQNYDPAYCGALLDAAVPVRRVAGASIGEGRWTALAAIDEGVPAPVLTAALFQRFASRGNDACPAPAR